MVQSRYFLCHSHSGLSKLLLRAQAGAMSLHPFHTYVMLCTELSAMWRTWPRLVLTLAPSGGVFAIPVP